VKTKQLTKAAIIAAIYGVGTYLLGTLGSYPIQIRATEVLTVLPYYDASTILGVTAGCFIANILAGLGPWDIFGGTFITFVAAILTNKSKNKLTAISWPIFLNAFGVSAYLAAIFKLPYWYNVLTIFVGEFISVGVLGYPFMLYLDKNAHLIGLDNKRLHDVNYNLDCKKSQKDDPKKY